jgi:predicted RNase H-like nuclease
MDDRRVLGVDACPGGWVGVALGGGRPAAYFAAGVERLVADALRDGPLAVVGIDIPIGLPEHGPRRADLLARAYVGVRRSSVFLTPVRAAVEAETHAEAVRINRDLAGTGVSAQAYGLVRRIREVDAWVRGAPVPVVEVHPEASFARMADHRPLPRKTTWAGAEARRGLLADEGVVLTADLGAAGAAAGVDDVLDATAAAWTARRVRDGEAESLPPGGEVFGDGPPAAIRV